MDPGAALMAGLPSLLQPVPFPPELQPHRGSVQTYAQSRIRAFSAALCARLAPTLTVGQFDQLIADTSAEIAQYDVGPQRALRLVLRHDCLSTGCGETGCLLCQYNPSRLCKRNLKAKYLIDDHLKAKCGAPLRVELVDDQGNCVTEGLPPGMQLEAHVLNGEKYKEVCPDNVLLTQEQLQNCIIKHHTRALLRREGGSDEQLRCFLQVERGMSALSDLQVTTSSEALLAGKAPTFRLLVWAVDTASNMPVSSVTYVVSEFFVVATKRVKHAIKSDIPSIADHVSKLVHIGKATVDKLLDLRSAAIEEGFEIHVPDHLNRVDTVGVFKELVELGEHQQDIKNKMRHLLKLSPEKWDEVAAHAQAAVQPDFRPRVWWCPPVKAGLLFSCKNGAVVMDTPQALVKMTGKGEEDQVIPLSQLDPQLFSTVPKLKASAMQSWYLASHPGWAIYYKEGQQDPLVQSLAAQQPPGSLTGMSFGMGGGMGMLPGMGGMAGMGTNMGGGMGGGLGAYSMNLPMLPMQPPLNMPGGGGNGATRGMGGNGGGGSQPNLSAFVVNKNQPGGGQSAGSNSGGGSGAGSQGREGQGPAVKTSPFQVPQQQPQQQQRDGSGQAGQGQMRGPQQGGANGNGNSGVSGMGGPGQQQQQAGQQWTGSSAQAKPMSAFQMSAMQPPGGGLSASMNGGPGLQGHNGGKPQQPGQQGPSTGPPSTGSAGPGVGRSPFAAAPFMMELAPDFPHQAGIPGMPPSSSSAGGRPSNGGPIDAVAEASAAMMPHGPGAADSMNMMWQSLGSPNNIPATAPPALPSLGTPPASLHTIMTADRAAGVGLPPGVGGTRPGEQPAANSGQADPGAPTEQPRPESRQQEGGHADERNDRTSAGFQGPGALQPHHLSHQQHHQQQQGPPLGGGGVLESLRGEEMHAVASLDLGRGLSQLPSLLGDGGPSLGWQQHMPGMPGPQLAGLGSDGSLNGTINALISESLQGMGRMQSTEPPTKQARLQDAS